MSKKAPTAEAARLQFQQSVLSQVRAELEIAVQKRGVSRTALARKMEVPESHVAAWLDTPQNLYDHPTNMFVAGFIGSPSMNFFPANLEQSGQELLIKGEGFQVKVPAGRK